jgi:hypothetical protein
VDFWFFFYGLLTFTTVFVNRKESINKRYASGFILAEWLLTNSTFISTNYQTTYYQSIDWIGCLLFLFIWLEIPTEEWILLLSFSFSTELITHWLYQSNLFPSFYFYALSLNLQYLAQLTILNWSLIRKQFSKYV